MTFTKQQVLCVVACASVQQQQRSQVSIVAAISKSEIAVANAMKLKVRVKSSQTTNSNRACPVCTYANSEHDDPFCKICREPLPTSQSAYDNEIQQLARSMGLSDNFLATMNRLQTKIETKKMMNRLSHKPLAQDSYDEDLQLQKQLAMSMEEPEKPNESQQDEEQPAEKADEKADEKPPRTLTKNDIETMDVYQLSDVFLEEFQLMSEETKKFFLERQDRLEKERQCRLERRQEQDRIDSKDGNHDIQNRTMEYVESFNKRQMGLSNMGEMNSEIAMQSSSSRTPAPDSPSDQDSYDEEDEDLLDEELLRQIAMSLE